ncbi:trichohyalin-like [Anopheles nili]|uniref:trichohyalin-like n=1 Tax=Anopheles nili TaxID=185578 RepID=UPI00237B427E|nr:trichohyalin-like [Anopheles nili]
MAKVLVIVAALFVLGAAAPQYREQKPGTPLQERRTKMDWEELTNTIEEVFGIATSSPEERQESEEIDESSNERQSERRREFIERQRDRSDTARTLEDREERNREAMERAQGRLPEREARRQSRQKENRQLKQLSERKRKQWEQDQGQDEQRDEKKKDRYYNDFPLYEFAYGVHDPETGDNKEQWEKRVGDHVKGKYTLDQPDGTKRIVEYEADDRNGFEAVVKEIDRIDDRHRGDVRWGHSDGQVAQSYSKLKKVD